MNVCLIAPYAYRLFHPNDERILPFGGAEVQQYQLGRELAKDATCAVSFCVGDFFPGQPTLETYEESGRKVTIYKTIAVTHRSPILEGLADFWKLYRAMKKANADIYLIRGGGSLAGKVSFLAQRVLHKKFIYSSAHDRESSGDFFRTHALPVSWLFRYAVRNANTIICQHEGQRLAFSQTLNRQAVVLRTMYHIGKPEQLNMEKREYILWVSRLHEWKQPELFVELARYFPEQRFVLITSAETASFRKTIGTIPNLTIQKHVPFDMMDTYFSRAKLFINTSRQEGFPNTFVQAAKNGTPIASLQVDPDDMLTTYHMGTCAHGDFARLITDMREMLQDVKLWKTMAKNAYEYAAAHHDVQTIVPAYKEVFQSLLASP